jgi:hypothetical protein
VARFIFGRVATSIPLGSIPLTPRWTAVVLRPVPELDLAVVGLFLDGELVELVDEDDDVDGYIEVLAGAAG